MTLGSEDRDGPPVPKEGWEGQGWGMRIWQDFFGNLEALSPIPVFESLCATQGSSEGSVTALYL